METTCKALAYLIQVDTGVLVVVECGKQQVEKRDQIVSSGGGLKIHLVQAGEQNIALERFNVLFLKMIPFSVLKSLG